MTAPLDMRVTPARPDLAAVHLRGIVEAQRYATGTRHAVAASVVALRRQPRADHPIDTELLFGETVTVYDTDAEGWSWGQAETDGYVGWLPSALLGPPDPPAATHKVAALRTFVYAEASIKSPVVTLLPFGARLVVAATDAAFARIAGGYVWSGHLVPVHVFQSDVIAVAETFLETPYLWGGRSSLGIDCSGLVQSALGACGRPVPRDSDMQERELGAPIDPDGPLRRGDLVFWRGHVGLMRDGATLLHANGHTMSVALEDLAAARRRIVAAGGGEVTSVRRLPA